MQSWSKSHGRAQHSTPRAKTDRSRIANEKSVLKTFTNVRLLHTVACTYCTHLIVRALKRLYSARESFSLAHATMTDPLSLMHVACLVYCSTAVQYP